MASEIFAPGRASFSGRNEYTSGLKISCNESLECPFIMSAQKWHEMTRQSLDVSTMFYMTNRSLEEKIAAGRKGDSLFVEKTLGIPTVRISKDPEGKEFKQVPYSFLRDASNREGHYVMFGTLTKFGSGDGLDLWSTMTQDGYEAQLVVNGDAGIKYVADPNFILHMINAQKLFEIAAGELSMRNVNVFRLVNETKQWKPMRRLMSGSGTFYWKAQVRK